MASPDWLLVAGSVILGAVWLVEMDQPWCHCKFEPTAAYEAVRPLFDAVRLKDGKPFPA